MMIFKYINQMSPIFKTLTAIFADFVTAGACFYLSIVLRIGNLNPYSSTKDFLLTILIISFAQSIVFNLAGLYKGIWRYSSTHDLLRIIRGATLAVAISTLVFFLINRLTSFPRSAIIIDWFLLVVSLGGVRFTYRIWRDNISLSKNNSNCLRILIIGAGNAGDQLIRQIKKDPSLNLYIVGIVDDNNYFKGKSIQGVPVLGDTSTLQELIKKYLITKVYIAIPSASGKEIRNIINSCDNEAVEFKTLPKLKDILHQQVDVTQLRNVKPSDLLGRAGINLDKKIIFETIENKKIMITGAGGSIGSEICRQLLSFNPESLIVYDFNELFIYNLLQSLNAIPHKVKIIPIIGDVKNREKLDSIFMQHTPEIIFHAAAYKHVPLMEENPYEAVQTNIAGTRNLIDISLKHNIERFVLISTDKAVNPPNIMGATKRIAEITLQQKIKCTRESKEIKTKLMTTRFGNVLGSSGSVIPLFTKQIKAGGPITVTHPEVTRYFMTIPEATQLVLQAGSMGDGGEIFHFDMGEPVKIATLAKQMIHLYGLKVGDDIDIKFIGLRPGEKLYEELLDDKEKVLPTSHPLLKIAKARAVNDAFSLELTQLLDLRPKASVEDFKNHIKKLVPEYGPTKEEERKRGHEFLNEEIAPHYQ